MKPQTLCMVVVLAIVVGCAGARALPGGGESQYSIPRGVQVPFLQNVGQYGDAKTAFQAVTFAGAAGVMPNGDMVHALTGPRVDGHHKVCVLRERLLGAQPAVPVGEQPSAARIAYIAGRESGGWHASVPAFDQVAMAGVYEGIGLKLRACPRNIEKIFHVAPGADPGQIAIEVQGALGLSVTATGELQAETDLGPVRFGAPVAYQVVDGVNAPVRVAYAVSGSQYGFALGDYDSGHELIIDPMLSSTFIGGGSRENVSAIVVGDSGAVYIAGSTWSSGFPVTPGAYSMAK